MLWGYRKSTSFQNVTEKTDIANAYNAAFKDLEELELPVTRPGANPSWHLYVIRLNLDKLNVDREVIFKALRAENIGSTFTIFPFPGSLITRTSDTPNTIGRSRNPATNES